MSTAIRDYKKLAKDIIINVGGEANIVSAVRCATRLRLVLKESNEEMKEKIKGLTGVITVVENNGQFQIVIGTHVGEVFDSISEDLNLDELNKEGIKTNQTIFNRIIATMSAVFAPFIYILAASGILQGVLIIITMFWPVFSETGTHQVFSFISWASFTFLPIFIAVTASKHFKVNTFLAIACCSALVSPTWAEMAGMIAEGGSVNFLGLALSPTVYTSSVLPPLFLVLALSYLEKFVEKLLPEVLKTLFTPFICMVVIVPLTILIIGPVSTIVANGFANGYNFLYETVPAIAGAIVGGFWQVFVIFGVHWGIQPVILANFDLYGQDSFQAFQTAAVIAQVGAAFGVMLKSKNKELKNISLSAGITGVFGITEPTVYGVTLRLKKPFICACVAGGIGAIVMSFFHSMYYVYAGLPGVLTMLNAYSPNNPSSLMGELVGCGIAFFGAIILVQIVGFDDPKEENKKEKSDFQEEILEKEDNRIAFKRTNNKSVLSPLDGKIVKLSEVRDEVFANGIMGKGIAIEPKGNKVYAPFNGTVVSVLDSKHAIGIRSDDGLEVLIHVGLDTVRLEGKYFEMKTAIGHKVKAGELLLEFDREGIQNAGYPLITPVIVTNSDDYLDVLNYPKDNVNIGDELLAVMI